MDTTEPEAPVPAAATEAVEPKPTTVVVSRRALIVGASAVVLVIAGLVTALVYLGTVATNKAPPPAALPPVAAVPAPPPVDMAALKLAAEARKKELLEMHSRVLQTDSAGVIPDFPRIRATPKPAAEAPAPPPLENAPGAAAARPAAVGAPPEKTDKPALTPMGRDGLGVSKDNIGGLIPAIEAMNAMESRPKKREK